MAAAPSGKAISKKGGLIMAIIEFRGGPVTRASLMKKTKDDLARMILDLFWFIEQKDERIAELDKELSELRPRVFGTYTPIDPYGQNEKE
jgi:hypothetical protein